MRKRSARLPALLSALDARTTSLAVLAALAALDLVLVVVLMSGGGYSGRVLGIPLRVNDFMRPLMAGPPLAIWLLFLGRRESRARTAALALLIGFGLLGLVAYAREAEQMTPVGDIALIESYTDHALRGQLLVGPYSRYSWHHPGPLYFFMLAPFYALSEYRTVGLAAGAFAINLGSLLIIAWTMYRAAGGVLAIATTAVTIVYMWRIDRILASPWNAHVLVLPAMALIVVSAAMLDGRLGLLLLVIPLASFTAQTHVALLPLVLAVAGCSAVGALLMTHRSDDAHVRARGRRLVNAALWLLLALWIHPLAEQLSNTPGNLGELGRFFFTEERRGQPLGAAFAVWADQLSALLRPDLSTAWGNLYVPSTAWWPRYWAVVQLFLLSAVALRAARRRQRFLFALSALLLLASMVALWSVVRVEDEIYDHVIFWISGISALTAAVLLAAAIDALWRRGTSLPPRAVATVCGVLCIIAAVASFQPLRAFRQSASRLAPQQRTALRLSQGLREYLRTHPGEKPLFRIDQPTWGVAAGVILQLQKAGVSFSVERDWIPMFSHAVAPKGDETSDMTFAGPERHVELMQEPGHDTIAERDRVFIVLTRVP